MTQETKDFIETWKEKIERINGDMLEHIFEKFHSLYILHNRLYNESFRILKDAGKLVKTRYSDHEKASVAVIEYLSADLIVNRLKQNGNFNDLESIAELIQNKIFNINLVDGKAIPDIDKQLMENLRSNDSNILSKATLMTIYKIRSNMVHGEKHFEEHQRMILEPLIRILQTIIDLQIESHQ